MPPDFIFTLNTAGIFVIVLIIVGAIAAGLHALFALEALQRWSKRVSDLSPVVMTLCGTLFVLSVTFLANSVWQMEDRARESIHGEARSIRVMRSYVDAMTGPSRDGFNRLLLDYGAAVAKEWPSLRDPDARREAEQVLSGIYKAVIAGLSEGEQNRVLQQRLIVALDALSVARQQRLSMAQDVVSAGQWFLVTALGLLVLVAVAVGHGRFPAARRVALALLAVAISIAIFVIIAHDRPFIGDMAVSPQPILRATGNID